MTLDDINTKDFLFDPKGENFTLKMIKKAPVFDIQSVERTRWLAYITIVYDVNSELRKNSMDNIPRKTEAAKIVGFEQDESGNFKPEVEEYLLGKNEDFNKAIIQYVYYMFNNEYKSLYVLQEQYDLAIREASVHLKVLDDKERKSLKTMREEIEELEKSIFKGKELPDIRRALYEGIENVKDKMPRTEAEIEEFEKNGLDPWSPYGDYRPEKLSFVGDKIPIE